MKTALLKAIQCIEYCNSNMWLDEKQYLLHIKKRIIQMPLYTKEINLIDKKLKNMSRKNFKGTRKLLKRLWVLCSRLEYRFDMSHMVLASTVAKNSYLDYLDNFSIDWNKLIHINNNKTTKNYYSKPKIATLSHNEMDGFLKFRGPRRLKFNM